MGRPRSSTAGLFQGFHENSHVPLLFPDDTLGHLAQRSSGLPRRSLQGSLLPIRGPKSTGSDLPFAWCLDRMPPENGRDLAKTGPNRRSACRRCVTPSRRERGTFVRSRDGLAGGNRPARSAPPFSLQLECFPSPALKYSVMIPISLAAARSPAGKATIGAAAEPPASPLSGRRTPALGHSCLASWAAQ